MRRGNPALAMYSTYLVGGGSMNEGSGTPMADGVGEQRLERGDWVTQWLAWCR